jgi:transposase
MKLSREIRDRGYRYGNTNVLRFVAQLRRAEAAGQPVGTDAPRTPRVPTARNVAGLFLRRPEDLEAEQKTYLEKLTATNTAVATAYRLTQGFATMVRERQSDRLAAWLAEAEMCDVPALGRFAGGLRGDLAAVRAGLTEQWSNGPTEGFIHKLKLVKRQAYGRAGFAVLRQRLVRAAEQPCQGQGVAVRGESRPVPLSLVCRGPAYPTVRAFRYCGDERVPFGVDLPALLSGAGSDLGADAVP